MTAWGAGLRFKTNNVTNVNLKILLVYIKFTVSIEFLSGDTNRFGT